MIGLSKYPPSNVRIARTASSQVVKAAARWLGIGPVLARPRRCASSIWVRVFLFRRGRGGNTVVRARPIISASDTYSSSEIEPLPHSLMTAADRASRFARSVDATARLNISNTRPLSSRSGNFSIDKRISFWDIHHQRRGVTNIPVNLEELWDGNPGALFVCGYVTTLFPFSKIPVIMT